MAPALTKILKEGHGIHPLSPPASAKLDSDRPAVGSAEPESHLGSKDDPQKMRLNLSLFPALDSSLPISNLDAPANTVPPLTPCASARQCETMVSPGPASLLSLISSNKGQRGSHQVASVFPGVPDMFLIPVPECNNQETCLLDKHSTAPDCGRGGADVLHPHLGLTSVPPYSHREINYQGYGPFSVPLPALRQEEVTRMNRPLPPLQQLRSGMVSSDHLAPGSLFGEVVKEKLSRQEELHSRTQRLRKRLQALLGEHALLHCNQQLEGLRQHSQLEGVPLDSSKSIQPGVLPLQVDCEPSLTWLDSSMVSASLAELGEFSCSSQAVLRGLQEALDSEATASSSSDEEQEKETSLCKSKSFTFGLSSHSSGGSCEKQWLEERAELGSRWSWLELRLTELEGRIQQLVGLHKHIRSMKGGVVLAESQPLTGRQTQQTLLSEMAGLSRTATDADNEPCSPTRLLHNMERQSAQLSQIVNSLIPPLSFSPLPKQAHTWRGKGGFPSEHKGDDVFVPGSSKRRRLGARRLFKADLSCVCARTRPLVTYHKPRLFTFRPSSPQDSGMSISTLRSSLSSSSCSCCATSDPVVLCSDPDCSSNKAHCSRTTSSPTPSVSSLSFDIPRSHHMKRTPAKEVWSQRPLLINLQPALYSRRSSTPMHNRHKYKQHANHQKSRVMGLSPIGNQNRRASQRKRKRRHIRRFTEDEEDVFHQLCPREDSSDEVLEEGYMQVSCKPASQGYVLKRQGESVYNIDNIVIPMSLAKVEKLQYKDILTPSWRMVDTMSLHCGTESDNEEGQVEDLTDYVFAQRHFPLEKKEKLHWSTWEQTTCCRRPKRSGSMLSGSGGGMCTSGEEESSAELSCTQLDADEQQSSEEWLLQPQTPWEPRVFPLGEDEEEALLSDDLGKVSSGWPEFSSASSTSKNSISQLSTSQLSGATLSSGGQSENSFS